MVTKQRLFPWIGALVASAACSGLVQQESESDGLTTAPTASSSASGTASGSTTAPDATMNMPAAVVAPGDPSTVAPTVPQPVVAVAPSSSATDTMVPEPAAEPVPAEPVPAMPVTPEPVVDPEPSSEPVAEPEMSEPVPEPVPEPIPEPVPEPESVPGVCGDLGGYDQGSATFYTFSQGTVTPNCSYEVTGRNPDSVAHIATGNGQYFGAMNTADYNTAAMCGACVEMTRDGGRTVTITIVDQCPIGTNPKCKPGHIDLSQAAFQQIGETHEGYLGTGNGGMYGQISWRYVPCPIQENVSFRLKEPDRTDWNELLVQGHAYPIQSVEINGQVATRKEYNYWEPPGGRMGEEPFKIKVTDVNGGVLNVEVARSNGDMMSTAQLMCQ